MKRKGREGLILTVVGIALSFSFIGCKPAATCTPTTPKFDVSNLDSFVESNPENSEFARNVKSFFRALQAKDWQATYDLRSVSFKQDVSSSVYLREMSDAGKSWTLDNFRILSVSVCDNNCARLIMEFTENGQIFYNCMMWKKDSGAWVCDEPGIVQLPLLINLRGPEWCPNSKTIIGSP